MTAFMPTFNKQNYPETKNPKNQIHEDLLTTLQFPNYVDSTMVLELHFQEICIDSTTAIVTKTVSWLL